MFRIGEFSRIAQTPITQLRYYDQIGLFQPKYIDQFTGYRYYRATQLPDLNRILAMKDLGLTLEQIKRLVADDVSAEEIRGMLSLKKAQVEQELHDQIARLNNIEVRLRQVEQDGAMSLDDVVLKEIPAQPIYSFRTILSHLLLDAARYLTEMNTLLPQRVTKKTLGHFTAVYHTEDFTMENADVELGFLLNDAVDDPLPLADGQEMSMRILPRIETAVCVVRVGGFENGCEGYGKIGRWLEANHYKLAGPPREVFIITPSLERLDETVCEIQMPVIQEQRPALPRN